jgi:hypothetical protein
MDGTSILLVWSTDSLLFTQCTRLNCESLAPRYGLDRAPDLDDLSDQGDFEPSFVFASLTALRSSCYLVDELGK